MSRQADRFPMFIGEQSAWRDANFLVATEQVAGNSEDSSLKPGRNAEERHFDEEVQGRDALQLQKYIPPPQKRGQAGGCAAGAGIQHRRAAEGAPSTAAGVKAKTVRARQGAAKASANSFSVLGVGDSDDGNDGE